MRQLLIILLLSLHILSHSQELLKENIVLQKNIYTSKELLSELINKHNLNIFFAAEDVDASKPFTFSSGNLESIIDRVGKFNNLEFKILYNQIILKKKSISKVANPEPFYNSIQMQSSEAINNQVKCMALSAIESKNQVLINLSNEMKLKNYKSKAKSRIYALAMAAILASNTNTFSQFDFGISAGANISGLTQMRSEKQSFIPGFQAGITMVTPINKSVHLRNDVLFIENNMKITHPFDPNSDYSIKFEFDERPKVYSLRVPLTINYVFQKAQMNFYFGIGAYYEMLLFGSNKMSWKNEEYKKDVSFNKGEYNDFYESRVINDTTTVVESSNLVLNKNQLGLVLNMGLSRKAWIFNLSYEPSLTQYPIEGHGDLYQLRLTVSYLLGRKESSE